MFKKLIIILSLLICFNISFLSSQTEDEKEKIKQVLKTFETAWETKNLSLLESCFHKLSDQQIKMYKTLFPLIDRVDIEFTIKDVYIEKIFGGITTKMKKTVRFKMEQIHGLSETKEENINYLLMKKNGKWGIIGTVHPDEKKKTVKITDKNVHELNKSLQKVPEDKRKELFQQYSTISKTRNKINFKKSPLIYKYTIKLNTEEDDTKSSNKVIWKIDNYYIPWVEIPEVVLNDLQDGEKYYLKVKGFDKENNQVETYIFNLKYKKE